MSPRSEPVGRRVHTVPHAQDTQPESGHRCDNDSIWVFDLINHVPQASSPVAQTTATPASWKFESTGASTTPVMVIEIPGIQPLTIGCPRPHTWHSRFSWRGKVPPENKPAFVVSETDWLTLTNTFGLASFLEDKGKWATS